MTDWTWIPRAQTGDVRCPERGCTAAVLGRKKAGRKPTKCPEHATRSKITKEVYHDGEAVVLRHEDAPAKVDGQASASAIWIRVRIVTRLATGESVAAIIAGENVGAELVHEIEKESRDSTTLLGRLRSFDRGANGELAVIAQAEAMAAVMLALPSIPPGQLPFAMAQFTTAATKLAAVKNVKTIRILGPEVEAGER